MEKARLNAYREIRYRQESLSPPQKDPKYADTVEGRSRIKFSKPFPKLIVWLLRMERNRRVFYGIGISIEQSKDKWLNTLFF